ncbi:MAG TPA: hypothetical protein VJ001_09635 [Rhodocyclaceae bacterium]|nr:hypothetical protein [Rhodocyclaceae bacterium]
MKTIAAAVWVVGMLSSFSVPAQMGATRAPEAPQAISRQLQQARTLEQREAMEAKKLESTPTPKPGGETPKKSPKKVKTAAKPSAS